MGERPRRTMYYIDGSTVRKVEQAPSRKSNNEVHKKSSNKQTQQRRVSEKAQNALAFNMGYTIFVTAAVLIMVFACIAVLYMESRISLQQANINELETQLEVIEEENAAYKLSLENMYTLDEIYDVATNELGMVYAEKGQIVYYESADEDYVKQYQDVPEAN
ncbi:MAG: cell division protein FtsL [Lachnospiraceae bacterium]|nr:cell division protein FtsL [Lachnospiraceae bacterium]